MPAQVLTGVTNEGAETLETLDGRGKGDGAEAGILTTGYWGVESMAEEPGFIGTSISSYLIERGRVVTCMLALG
jgi:hypothetical protein